MNTQIGRDFFYCDGLPFQWQNPLSLTENDVSRSNPNLSESNSFYHYYRIWIQLGGMEWKKVRNFFEGEGLNFKVDEGTCSLKGCFRINRNSLLEKGVKNAQEIYLN